jgi:alanyl-tRNA synthetase
MPSSSEIRQQFIDFFCKKQGHTFVPSSPVVPLNDPTLLFANAGMNQFKPYFLGTEKPPHARVANTQKCIRAGGKHNDLDDVGRDTYHHTFFEMLGNWSFGDYFKKEAIAWAWELLTQVWKLDPTRLHVTVFEGDPESGIERDEEAAGYWRAVGVPESQIHLGNKKDNFWEMGSTGPCGPCTEVHIDRTPDRSGGKLVNAGTDKVIEIWNLVFIQFNRNEDQSLTPLPAKHVDTGMGFERICSVLQGKGSNYDTDVFTPIFEAIRKATLSEPYTGKLDDLKDTAYRVIADHIRTLTFALTDGAAIGNDGRDYVLKRILRRAVRYGVQVLGTGDEPFLHELVPVVVEHFGTAFPELKNHPQRVRDQIYDEEVGFLRTIDRGIRLFRDVADRTRKAGSTVISGKDAFKLHDTYGVLIDLTQQMAGEQDPPMTVDLKAFEVEMERAHAASKAGSKKVNVAAVQGELPQTDDAPKYGPAQIEATVLGWVVDNAVVRTGKLTAGESAALLLDRTNFYAEQGGQVGDTGTLISPSGASFDVEDTQRLGEAVLHVGTLDSGELAVGDRVLLNQSIGRRVDVVRNHTATHLLNLALRQVVGGDVEQKGSLVDEQKTRFDFSHDRPLSSDELREIERRVNRDIMRDQPVAAVVMPLAEAKKLPGVRAVFGEKYPDPVRVVMIGAETPEQVTLDNSVEFCGGTHAPSTGRIGMFKIVSQEAVAKGVRRVVAVTGRKAITELENRNAVLDELAARFQCRPEELPARIDSLQEHVKKLEHQLKKGAAADLTGTVDKLLADAPTVGGAKLVVGQLPTGTQAEAVRTQIDRIKQKAGSAFVLLGWADDEGKVSLLAALSPDLIKKGLKAGDVVKQVAAVVGGSGGGRPEMAQAGGKDPAKLPDAIKKAADLGKEMLGR